VAAHVEAEDWHLQRRKVAGRPQHRAVASEYNRQIRWTFLISQQPGERVGLWPTHGHADVNALLTQDLGTATGLAQRRLAGGTMNQPDSVETQGLSTAAEPPRRRVSPQGGYQRSRLKRSMSTVSRFRYRESRMANPTAASAAATVITKMANTWPRISWPST